MSHTKIQKLRRAIESTSTCAAPCGLGSCSSGTHYSRLICAWKNEEFDAKTIETLKRNSDNSIGVNTIILHCFKADSYWTVKYILDLNSTLLFKSSVIHPIHVLCLADISAVSSSTPYKHLFLAFIFLIATTYAYICTYVVYSFYQTQAPPHGQIRGHKIFIINLSSNILNLPYGN